MSERAAFVEPAQVHGVVDARDASFLGKLPQRPLGAAAQLWLAGGVAGNEERIVGKGGSQQVVEKRAAGVNHRAATVVFLHQVGKHLDAVAQLLCRPALPRLHIDERNEVLVGFLGRALEIFELVLDS